MTRTVLTPRRAALVALCLLVGAGLAACGSESGGTTTITVADEPTTQPAATSAPAPATSAAATTTAAETQPPASSAPTVTDTLPPESVPAQTFTVGQTDVTDVPTEEPPPEDTTSPPPESSDELPPETDAPADTEGGVERPADFPSKREARLLGLVFGDIATQCTRTAKDEVTAGADASIYCDLRTGDKVQAWYESFPNVAAMRRAYDGFRSRQGIRPNTRSCQPNRRYPAEAPWYQGSASNTLGRLICFVDDGDVWLVWTHDRFAALGWAVNRGGQKQVVWDFWRLRGLLGS